MNQDLMDAILHAMFELEDEDEPERRTLDVPDKTEPDEELATRND